MSKRVRTLTDNYQILSSNYLKGTFDVRCEFVNAFHSQGNRQGKISFSTPFLRGLKWQLNLSVVEKVYSSQSSNTDDYFAITLSSVSGDESFTDGRYSSTTQKMLLRTPFDYSDRLAFDLVLDKKCRLGSWAYLITYSEHWDLVVRLNISFLDYVQPAEKATLVKLYKSIDSPLCDFEIKTEGGSLKVFSNILRLKWPYFETMMNADHLENSSKCWIVDDVGYDTMKDIVVYVYCDTITLNGEERVIEILKTAHRYELQTLVDACENYLYYDIDLQYALQVFVVSHLYELSKLKTKCADLISAELFGSYMSQLPGYDEFAEHPDVLMLTEELLETAVETS
ncbi:Protein maternal effect lethal 26 [Halotydeus destructor]|nr:Protein maternal effect lethal 26 [Halotydeus destructor]